MLFVLSPFMVPASVQAQWVVSDPGNLVQGIVNVSEMDETLNGQSTFHMEKRPQRFSNRGVSIMINCVR